MIHKTAGELTARDLGQHVTITHQGVRRAGPLVSIGHDRADTRTAFVLAPGCYPTSEWWPHDAAVTVEDET